MSRPHVLHLHSTFSAGGKELRCVQLINAFGSGVCHTIVSAVPDRLEAARLISNDIEVTYPQDFPPLQGRPTPGRLHRIAQGMRGYDLVLTYNWGAMDAAMAHTIFGQHLGLPPLIHHEDGFNEDERHKLKTSRNWYRRIALGRASNLIVPSETLEEIALETWRIPINRVRQIPNGIDTQAFAKPPRGNALPGIRKREGDLWLGTVAGLRKVKNIPSLVRAFSSLPEPWQLVIVGEGPEAQAIGDEARRLGIADRVHLPGFARDPRRFVGLFDIFALSSDTEQFPISVVEAMAAGKPVAAPAVGDIAHMLSDENARLISPAGDEDALAGTLLHLAGDADRRQSLGQANQLKARSDFDEKAMIATYRRLYANAMGRSTLP
uniref:glycosyltransferase family 4 protein n=1 Tax=Parerythrobacter lutipelagi TaxID=1964208 RepID=UPI0010F685C8|nr:glycosyltransferase family 4 protein [Parerythrobacter lutipelagi]